MAHCTIVKGWVKASDTGMPSAAVLFSLALVGTSLTCLAMYGIDKHRAKCSRRRIPERTLLVASLLGPLGVVGVILFRHKIKKMSYVLKLLIVLVASLASWSSLGYLAFNGS